MRPEKITLTGTNYRTMPADALRLAALGVDRGWKLQVGKNSLLVICQHKCRCTFIISLLEPTESRIETFGSCAIDFLEKARRAAALTEVDEVQP